MDMGISLWPLCTYFHGLKRTSQLPHPSRSLSLSYLSTALDLPRLDSCLRVHVEQNARRQPRAVRLRTPVIIFSSWLVLQ